METGLEKMHITKKDSTEQSVLKKKYTDLSDVNSEEYENDLAPFSQGPDYEYGLSVKNTDKISDDNTPTSSIEHLDYFELIMEPSFKESNNSNPVAKEKKKHKEKVYLFFLTICKIKTNYQLIIHKLQLRIKLKVY